MNRAVFITNERLVGFTSLQGLILVTADKRILVFGSRLSRWEELGA